MQKPSHHAGVLSRRTFIGNAVAASGISLIAPLLPAGAVMAQVSRRPNSLIQGVQVGTITYSFYSMADQSAAALLRYCLECGINAIELMGDPAEAYAGLASDPTAARYRHLVQRNFNPDPPPLTPAEEQEKVEVVAARARYLRQVATWRASVSMEPFLNIRRMFNEAGITIYGYKPATFEKGNSDVEIDYGMRAARALGATHVTVELPEEVTQAARLGAAAQKHGLKVGYHQHLQATPTLWDAALAASPANGINLDLGHFTAAGDYDAIAFIRKYHDRITSMHLKDRRTKANGQANLPWGSGDTPLTAALQLMRDQKYGFPATIELEYPIPAGSDAVTEVRKCVDFCRRALEAGR